MGATRPADLLGAIILGWMSRLHARAEGSLFVLFDNDSAVRTETLIRAFGRPDHGPATVRLPVPPVVLAGIAANRPDSFPHAARAFATMPGINTLADVCRGCMGPDWDDRDDRIQRLGRLHHPLDPATLRALFAANDPASTLMRDRLESQRAIFEAWVSALPGGRERGLLLTGTLRDFGLRPLIAAILPDRDIRQALFGRITDDPDPARDSLVFHASSYRAGESASAMACHPELLARLFHGDGNGTDDTLFVAVLNHVRRYAALPRWTIETEMAAALEAFAGCLMTPTATDRQVLGLPPPTDGELLLDPERFAAENAGHLLPGPDQAFFTQHETAAPADGQDDGNAVGWNGSVAVVTRTKDRPLLLRRACHSVSEQSWRNLWWVVVNDGGDAGPVRDILSTSGIPADRIILIDNQTSVGMEAASNLGVRAVDTEFVVIHDDDDQWHPDFLKKSVRFLQGPRARAAGFDGVLSRAWRVSERIDGDRVTVLGAEPYMPWVSEVPLAQMAVGNFFAPISFLYRRRIFDQIGGYDESLPVLGDWRFNLDFLARANIGFLDSYLAWYHHRDTGSAQPVYANSVVGARSLHGQYFSVVTNGILRSDQTPLGLRTAVANAHQQRILERNMGAIRADLAKRVQPMSAPSVPAPPADRRLDQRDMRHIRDAVRRALPYTTSPARVLARLRWELRLAQMSRPEVRRKHLHKVLSMIPSPPDFDHIAYLRDHPEIWATRFNGRNELLPYHHYVLDGVDGGVVRPAPPVGQDGSS